MEILRRKRKKPVRGFLDDHFLIAMPGMKDDRFARAVIYMCAHSEEGAMGLMINQTQQMRFPDLLVQLGILNEQQAIRLPSPGLTPMKSIPAMRPGQAALMRAIIASPTSRGR